MMSWHWLALGMLLSIGAEAAWWERPLQNWQPPVLEQDEQLITYDCQNTGAPIYLPDCAATPSLQACSMFPDEVFSTAVLLGETWATAAHLGPGLGSEHRWFELAVSDVPGDFDVDAACRDESVPGDLNPRVDFAPTYVGGCPQPSGLIWVNDRATGGQADECGATRDCRAIVYGP
jgi:hypothetical protein